jgi:uncharacterized protein YbaR (Trm112 family)
MIDRKVLEILVCPIAKTGLRYDADNSELLSDRARLAYPIEKNIPLLQPEKARQLEDREIKK